MPCICFLTCKRIKKSMTEYIDPYCRKHSKLRHPLICCLVLYMETSNSLKATTTKYLIYGNPYDLD